MSDRVTLVLVETKQDRKNRGEQLEERTLIWKTDQKIPPWKNPKAGIVLIRPKERRWTHWTALNLSTVRTVTLERHKTLPRRTLQTAVGFPLIHAAAVAAKLHARTTVPAVPKHEEEHFTQQPMRIIWCGSARFIRVSLNNMRRILMNPVDRWN